jgi:long-chain fatty acid transport protein
MRRTSSVAVATTVVLAAGTVASAGGMVLPVRGVRTLARGGAFIAGADDADALWQDPAGLAHLAGNDRRALLFDAAFVYQTVDYAAVDATGAPLPTAHNLQPGQPIPALAGALGIGDRLVIAGGLGAPYNAVHRYAADGPQRYASVGLDGSNFVVVTAGVAYRVTDQLRIGATVQDLVSRISSRVVVSGCPGAMTCAADDRSFDASIEVAQTDYLAPSGSIGVQYDASPAITAGLVVQAPTRISGTGTLKLGLPSAPVFDNAQVTGDRARLSFTLPPSVRAGVEWHDAHLRIEAALDVELWSMHGGIVIAPDGMRVETVAAGSLPVARMTIPRDYATTFAPSLGIEWHGPRVMLGVGYAYETAAANAGDVSVLTVDASKHLVGLGGGYEFEGWQIGAAAGLVALGDVEVTPAAAKVPQLAPLADPASVVRTVNAGTYRSRYVIGGLRFARRW